ncbi:hypothetical protein ACJ73_10087, partial [Blastomyces percursus]
MGTPRRPTGMVTRSRGSHRDSTLELAFVSEGMFGRLLDCKIEPAADKGCDHLPILLRFAEDLPRARRARWSWKNADPARVEEGAGLVWVPEAFLTKDEVEGYAEYLEGFVQELAAKHGKERLSNSRGNTWWTARVAEAVEAFKETQRHPGRFSEGEVRERRWKRNREVKLAKAASFRGLMHRAGQDTRLLWKMA